VTKHSLISRYVSKNPQIKAKSVFSAVSTSSVLTVTMNVQSVYKSL